MCHWSKNYADDTTILRIRRNKAYLLKGTKSGLGHYQKHVIQTNCFNLWPFMCMFNNFIMSRYAANKLLKKNLWRQAEKNAHKLPLVYHMT